ncbi:kinase-like protein [Aaosphaeria arxii CBS 175.79]|uniref:Kinase-like protein n=1 Tax=Aaosphaeria arxii CBS 175.79 TaxID=1450172 RepID=A0A6A5YA41_9PLEO|nr:kinase-like protein [Aaosphaeria arxii CBS 175.79]KAF2021877.1 kinase-like protein [Aaosphaeria arxii CBS 175.79]
MTSEAPVLPGIELPLDGLSGEADINPQVPIVNVIEGKGEFLGGGATGLVERLVSGDVIKSPWTGRPTSLDCRQEMAIEAQIYERLGAHPRLVQFKHWDPVSHALTLEYMPNGNLKDYVQKHGHGVSPSQRQQWVMEVVEGVELLHSYNVIQGDVGPHNFLLDIDLSLKICDFGGSSLDGSQATVAPGVRYRLPSLGGTTIKEDLFALGSTIYFIVTGREPYEELTDEDQVEKLYQNGVFPGLSEVPFAEIIALCWRQEAESAKMIIELVRRSSEKCQST